MTETGKPMREAITLSGMTLRSPQYPEDPHQEDIVIHCTIGDRPETAVITFVTKLMRELPPWRVTVPDGFICHDQKTLPQALWAAETHLRQLQDLNDRVRTNRKNHGVQEDRTQALAQADLMFPPEPEPGPS